MKCPTCGKEWNQVNTIASNTYVCPFCGDICGKNGEKKEDIKLILKSIVTTYGIDVLQNLSRLNALLMDLAPHLEKERKLIIMVMREGILSQIMSLINKDEINKKYGINKCINQLVSKIWITEVAARYAVCCIANAVSMNIEFDEDFFNQSPSNHLRDNNEQKEKIITKDLGLVSEDAINYALKDCSAIGFKAMAANEKIEKLVVPKNVTTIYPKAFMNCTNLKKVELPNSIKNIGGCAFEGCCLLEEIIIEDNPNYKVIDGILIDKVNKKALRILNRESCNNVKIPDGIITLCKKAFDRSNAKTIDIPMTLSNIEEGAFYLTCNLEKITVDAKNTSFRAIDGVLHDRQGKTILVYPKGNENVNYYLEESVIEIGTQAFSCVLHLKSITFTSSLKIIGFRAFEYCMQIENLILPESVEIIGDRAFQYCQNLKSIMLSRCIQEIGDCAFYGCEKLETISIPKSVKTIGNLAFANCKKLRSIIIQENVNFIGDGAFVGCDSIEISIKDNPYVETYCKSRGIKYIPL